MKSKILLTFAFLAAVIAAVLFWRRTPTVETKPSTPAPVAITAPAAAPAPAVVTAAPAPAKPVAVAPVPAPQPAQPAPTMTVAAAQPEEPLAPEVAATRRMIMAHAPLRTQEVADPDSETNRRILQTMVTKALSRTDPKPSTQTTASSAATPR